MKFPKSTGRFKLNGLFPIVRRITVTQKNRTRPTYSQEFKEQAVAKYLELGLTKTCKELGISVGSLRKWIDKSNNASSTSEKPSYEDLEKENRKLRKEIGYVNEINNILKKAQPSSQAKRWTIFSGQCHQSRFRRSTGSLSM